MSFMFFSNFVINKNIVQIYLTKIINIFEQQIVYIMLLIRRKLIVESNFKLECVDLIRFANRKFRFKFEFESNSNF